LPKFRLSLLLLLLYLMLALHQTYRVNKFKVWRIITALVLTKLTKIMQIYYTLEVVIHMNCELITNESSL
jgi:hypothetical protein